MNQTRQSARDAGIQSAMDSAERKHKDWHKKAYKLLGKFLRHNTHFMCEDFRSFCELKGLPDPPSKRAFGGIILKASKEGMIKRVGYGQVKNIKAHMANAAIWEPINKAA